MNKKYIYGALGCLLAINFVLYLSKPSPKKTFISEPHIHKYLEKFQLKCKSLKKNEDHYVLHIEGEADDVIYEFLYHVGQHAKVDSFTLESDKDGKIICQATIH